MNETNEEDEMWIMTSFGILMPASIPAGTQAARDGWSLQVRSRDRATLQKCRSRYMTYVTTSEIVETPTLDYEYRFYCHQDDFATAVAMMVDDIDYEKFKPTTEQRGGGGPKLHDLYNRIWGVVYAAAHPTITAKTKKGKKQK